MVITENIIVLSVILVMPVQMNYSLRLTLFVLIEKSNFLREHHLLFFLPYKNE